MAPHTPIIILSKNPASLPQLILEAINRGQVAVVLNPNLPEAIIKEQTQSLPQTIPGNAAVIIFTSGSSGQSKAVVLSEDNLSYSAKGSNQNIPFGEKDRWLVTLPMYHVSGLLLIWRALEIGGSLIFPTEQKSIDWNIREHKITHLSLVPSQLYTLLESPEAIETLKELKAILIGGSAFPIGLWQRAKDLSLPIYTTYGLSEMSSSITVSNGPIRQGDDYHSGKLLPYRELKISESGQILVKGKTLFLGYLQNRRLNLPLDSEGWFDTGDKGQLDEFGNLHVLGRSDNMFISGGVNIYPEEIETELYRIEGIISAIVVPTEDEKFGSRPIAFIKARENLEMTLETLSTALAKRLPKYKIPIAFYPWPTDYQPEGMKLDRKYFYHLLSYIKNTYN